MNTLAEVCRGGWEILHKNGKPLPPGCSIHEPGTCRKWDQSHDIKNLFAVDASSFVTGGSPNPTMTILSLSTPASEYLAEQMRAGNV